MRAKGDALFADAPDLIRERGEQLLRDIDRLNEALARAEHVKRQVEAG